MKKINWFLVVTIIFSAISFCCIYYDIKEVEKAEYINGIRVFKNIETVCIDGFLFYKWGGSIVNRLDKDGKPVWCEYQE